MANTFRPMRRVRQQLTHDECIDILCSTTSGVLAVAGDGGYPYAVPLSHVYDSGHLYFHSALQGHKVDAIAADARCSFCVIDRDEVHPESFTTYFKSVIAFGRIHIIDDAGERLAALRMLGHRHAPHDASGLQREIDKDFDRVLMLRLDIEHLTGKQAIELVNQRAACSTN